MQSLDVQRWLDAYIGAWRSNSHDDIVALFTERATYRYAPWKEPIVGAEAIAASWLEEPDDPGSWTATYRPQIVSGADATAVGTTDYIKEGKRYANLFVMRFGGDGRCEDFTEWYMKQPAAP